MPIYAYRCETCGFTKDVLQKLSDPVLVKCPSCHIDTFKRQLTAPGFQLKGSGWYVTDFKGGGAKAGSSAEPSAGKSDTQTESKAGGGSQTTPDSAAACAKPASQAAGACGAAAEST